MKKRRFYYISIPFDFQEPGPIGAIVIQYVGYQYERLLLNRQIGGFQKHVYIFDKPAGPLLIRRMPG